MIKTFKMMGKKVIIFVKIGFSTVTEISFYSTRKYLKRVALNVQTIYESNQRVEK